MDALPAEVVLLDERARIIAVNSAWRRFADANGLGDAQHGLRRSYLDVCEAPTAADSAGPAVARAIRGLLSGRGDRFSTEYASPSPAGTRWFEVCVAPLPVVDPARIVVTHTDVTDRKEVVADKARRDARLHRHREAERRRIAAELHDTTGRDLAGAVLLIGRTLSMLSASSEARPLLDEALSLCRKVLGDVRTLSYELRPPHLDSAGLPEALRWYARMFSRRFGIRLQVEVPPDLQRRSPQAELALFRAVQEVLSNLQRHSRAGTATIRLTHADEALELEVRDDGGDPAERNGSAARFASQGMQIMKDRIRACGGTLSVRSDERGTVIRATAPIVAEETR